MFDVIHDEIRRHRSHFGRKLHVGVFKLGGHGDFMQQLAFARAVRRRWPRGQATITLITKLSAPARPLPLAEGAEDVTADLLRGCGFVDSCIEVPAADWRVLAQELAPAFDIFYDVQYVAGTFFRNLRRFAAEQAEANARLARYAYYYSRFPWSNAELAETGQSQWEMLARSSGLDVSEDDLFIRPQADEGRGSRDVGRGEEVPGAASPHVPRPSTPVPSVAYATLHNAAGGQAAVKCMPPAAFDAIAGRLRELGMVPVQVGLPRETGIAGCLDCRGLTINQTAAVLAGARLHVDVEGGLVYVAKAVGTRSVVFFGPTPVVTFGFKGNTNVGLGRCEPCWWSRPAWERRCPKGNPFCRNLPDPKEAAKAVEESVMRNP